MTVAETRYDIAILGGGIAGVAIAQEAASRGLKVILFEKNSLGSGTSSKSSKLIHGGIRYLEIAWNDLKRGYFSEAWKNLRFVFVSLKEASKLEAMYPHLIHPIPLLAPVYRTNSRKRWSMYFGVILYYLLACLSGSATRAPKILLKPEEVLERISSLESKDLQGGVIFWDRLTDDKKLVEHIGALARNSGAKIHEKSQLLHYEKKVSETVFKLKVRTGIIQKDFYARQLVNATGAWVDRTRALTASGPDLVKPIAGCHIDTQPVTTISLLLEAEDGRTFFIINTGETSRIGTTERKHSDPDHVQATDNEVDYLLKSVNRYFPELGLSRKEILSTDAGIRPLVNTDSNRNASCISRDHKITRDPSGELHIVGVKLTDHRRAARDVLRHLR